LSDLHPDSDMSSEMNEEEKRELAEQMEYEDMMKGIT
jgi:hypothetical protein